MKTYESRIFFLDVGYISDGKIAENGTHEELLSKKGIYKDFVEIRKKSSGWNLA